MGTDQPAAQSGTVTTDEAAATADCHSELRENNDNDSVGDLSLVDHLYAHKFDKRSVLLSKQKRKRPRNDHLSSSDVSLMDTELAKDCSVVDSVEVRSKKRSTDMLDAVSTVTVSSWASDKSESLEAHLLSQTMDESTEFGVSDPVNEETKLYVCRLCGMPFDARQECSKHVSKVHMRKACRGTSDDRSTGTVSQMNTAVAEKHSVRQEAKKTFEDDILEVCDICGWIRTKAFRKPSLKEHKKKHSTEKPFKCSKCSMRFKYKPNVYRHENLHADVRRFLCQYCAQSFQQKVSLMNHMFKSHADKVDLDPNGTQYSCRYCSQTFYTSQLLRRHVMAEHQSAVCEKCGKKFASSGVLQQHKCAGVTAHGTTAAHTDATKLPGPTRPFGCNICDMRFTSVSRLERHMSFVCHTEDVRPAYSCQLCGEQFELLVALESHISVVHSIVCPRHTCTECGTSFSCEYQLKCHMLIHTDNAITCTVCGKKFVTQATLQSHMIRHTGERLAAEKLLRCSVCGKRFPNKQQLQLHEQIHSGAKPYLCNICGKAFRQLPHLYGHRRTHTKARPYCCSMCTKTYRNRIDLRYHCTRVHNVQLPLLAVQPKSV